MHERFIRALHSGLPAGIALVAILAGCAGGGADGAGGSSGGGGGSGAIPSTPTVAIPSAEPAALVAGKNGFSEAEFASNPKLKVQFGHVILTHLEAAASTGRKDVGGNGVDAFPLQIKTAGTYAFDLNIHPAHTLRLFDVNQKLVLSLDGKAKSSVALEAGDYLLELRSGAPAGSKADPIFVQLGTPVAPVKSALARRQYAPSESGAANLNRSVLVQTQTCQNCNLQGIDLSGQSFPSLNVAGSDLTGANLSQVEVDGSATMINAILKKVNFSGASLTSLTATNANFDDAVVEGANFYGARLGGTSWQRVRFDNSVILNFANMDQANLRGANFVCYSQTDITSCPQIAALSLHGADLTGATVPALLYQTTMDFAGATGPDGSWCGPGENGCTAFYQINGCVLGYATSPPYLSCLSDGTLTRGNGPQDSGNKLRNATLDFAPLAGAMLWGTDMSGISLQQADLRNALIGCAAPNSAVMTNLLNQGGFLPTVSCVPPLLNNANLSGANLSGASLNQASMSNANLTGANLSNATLEGTNLAGANLTGANLTGASLTGANFAGATWTDGHVCGSSGPTGQCN